MMVIVIGAGFAGLSAARILGRNRKEIETIVMDKASESSFLPMLPDVIGRGINPEYLTADIKYLAARFGFKFIKAEVSAVDLDKKEVLSADQVFPYDYLLISSGSETNFYGNEQVRKYAYKLDDASDARKIRQALEAREFDNYLISGGGYTGIEVATNLSLYFTKKSLKKKIVIVERTPSILGPLPQWMKDYVSNNLKKLGIEVLTNTAIEKIEDKNIHLQGAGVFDNAMLIWTAGVKASDFIQKINAEKNPQGRLKVDEYLRLRESCFVTGDSSYVAHKGSFLRMAVQFSIKEGECAAINIIRSIKGARLVKYAPVDLGYVIPMANNSSCGTILGINMKGLIPTFMHYFMCIYRSWTIGNKLGILKGLVRGGSY